MDPNHATEIVPYLSSAFLIMYAQRYLKSFGWYQKFVTAFPTADKWAHRLIAGMGALIAALGIGYTFDWAAATGGDIHVHIPDLVTLRHGVYDFVNVFVFQQGAYDMTKHPGRGPDPPTGATVS